MDYYNPYYSHTLFIQSVASVIKQYGSPHDSLGSYIAAYHSNEKCKWTLDHTPRTYNNSKNHSINTDDTTTRYPQQHNLP